MTVYTASQNLDTQLTIGWHKINFKASSSVARKAMAKLQSTPGTWIWDRLIRPRMVEMAAKNGIKIKIPDKSFFMNGAGQVRSNIAPGYQYIPRKGYDAKTGLFYFWVEVQGEV